MTTATRFALLRENAGITAVSAVQRDAINAIHAQTISTLADDLIGRNANGALDDLMVKPMGTSKQLGHSIIVYSFR